MPRRYLLIGLLCLAWIVPGLIGHEPWKTDEAFTFGVIYDMLRGGSWLVPTLAGEPFLDEPPLYYWLAAITATLASPLLPLHDGARLAAGLCMALTFVFTALAGRELHGKGQGAAAALLVLGTFGLVLRGHEGITDMAPLAGYALAYYAFALMLRRPLAGGVLLGMALGAVFLSQGILETAILAAIALVLPMVAPAWRTRGYAQAVALALAVAAPLIAAWPLALKAHPGAVFDLWLAREWHPLARGSERDTAFYLRILPWFAWPIWALALWQAWLTRGAHWRAPAAVLPLTGFAVTLIALSLASGARDVYALILLPAAALFTTPAATHLRRGAANAWLWFAVMFAIVFLLAGWFYWSALELGAPARLHAHLHRLQPGYPPGFKVLPFVLAACYSVAYFVLLAKLPRNGERPVVLWAASVTLLWGLSATLFLGWVDTGKRYRETFVSLRQALPAHYNCVASRSLGESQRGMLHYYADVKTRRAEVARDSQACNLLLLQGSPREEPKVEPGWRKIWEGGRPGDKAERYRLYRRGA